MEKKNRIGHVSKPGTDLANFAWLNRPYNWISHARTMRRAAEALHERMGDDLLQMRLEMQKNFAPSDSRTFIAVGNSIGEPWLVRHCLDHGPLLLMAGLSIEAALKAIRILRDPACVEGGKSKLGHQQTTIASDAGLTLSESERVLCELLSDFVSFAGRYPSAATADGSHDSISVGDDFFPEYIKFFDRLLDLYDREAADAGTAA